MTSFISPNLSQNFDVFSIIIDIKVMWFVESVNCSEFVDRSFSMAASSQVDGFPALSITSVSVTNSLQEWGRRRGAICPQNFSRPVSYLLAKFSPIFRWSQQPMHSCLQISNQNHLHIAPNWHNSHTLVLLKVMMRTRANHLFLR